MLRIQTPEAHPPGAPVASAARAARTVRTPPSAKYRGVYLASRLERVEAIKQGVPARLFVATIQDMGMTQDRSFEMLSIPRSSIAKRISADTTLTKDQSQLVMGLRRLIGQVEVMVELSGRSKGFRAAKWIGIWLEKPLPALGGRCPADFMDTAEGQEMLSALLAQMQSGAYA